MVIPTSLVTIALTFAVVSQLSSLCQGTVIRADHSNDQVNDRLRKDILECPNHYPTAQFRNTDEKLRKEYTSMFQNVQRRYSYELAPDTFINSTNMFTSLLEATFVFWGSAERGVLEMSVYNDKESVVSETGNGGRGVTWRFVDPQKKDFTTIKKSITLKGDYVAFVAFKFEVFAHFFLDNIGYIAYLREVTDPSTRFLFADVGESSRTRLETIDPEFARRVDWIQCDKACGCNQLVNVRNGSLTIVRPVSGTRHMNLLLKARKWILEANPPKQKSLKERTIVYYTRNADNAGHGRAIDLTQENIMLDIIKNNMVRYGRKEKLVIFDGKQPLEEQIDIFQSANIVIGAHGGGLANLIFLLPATSCESRPKVLEFLTNELTPEVQRGALGKTYFNLYSTCPWAEYHHVFYIPPSTEETTYIDLQEFEDAVQLILGGEQPSLTVSSMTI